MTNNFQSNNKRTFRFYLITILIQLFGGTILVLIFSEMLNIKRVLILGLIANVIVTFSYAILNLLYFLPKSFNRIKFIFPGLVYILLVSIIYQPSWADILFFQSLGVINLICGFIWRTKAMNNTPDEVISKTREYTNIDLSK